jgi:hypothetical protein
MPSTIIQPRKVLATIRALIRTLPKMAPLVTSQGDFPREFLATYVASEPPRPSLGTQSLKDGRPFALVWVIGPHVSAPIFAGREADRSEVAVHGTQERPVVAAVVGLAVFPLVVTMVEEFAQHAPTLEELGP